MPNYIGDLNIYDNTMTSLWKFDGNANDAKGVNNGTGQGSPTYGVGYGKFNQGIHLVDSSSQWVSTATSYSDPRTFTLICWARITSSADSNGNHLFAFCNSQTGTGSNYDRHLAISHSTGVVSWYGYGGCDIVGTVNYIDGKWHCYMVTSQSAGTAYLYVDGNLIGSDGVAYDTYTGYWRLGARGINTANHIGHVNGELDEMAWWNGTVKSSTWFKKYYAWATGKLI